MVQDDAHVNTFRYKLSAQDHGPGFLIVLKPALWFDRISYHHVVLVFAKLGVALGSIAPWSSAFLAARLPPVEL